MIAYSAARGPAEYSWEEIIYMKKFAYFRREKREGIFVRRLSTHHYGGFYHIVGRILQGDDCHRPDGTVYLQPIYDHFKVGYTNKVDLISQDFPRPSIQLEFEHNLPWVIDEIPE